MQSNLHRPRTQRLTFLAVAFFLGLVLAASGANAASVRMKGATATTTGTATLKIKDFRTCRGSFLGINLTFSATRRKFTAFDDRSRKLTGSYKQSGSGKRKITFKFDKKSKKRMENVIESVVKDCARARSVSIDVEKIKLTGKVNRKRNSVTLKGKFEVEGKADGDSGEATYTFKTSGPLTLTR